MGGLMRMVPAVLVIMACVEPETVPGGDPGAPPSAERFLPPLPGQRVDDEVDAGEVRASLDHAEVAYVDVRRRLLLDEDGFGMGDVTVVTFAPGTGGPERYLRHRFGDAAREPVEVGGVGMHRIAADPFDALAWTGPGFAVVFTRGAAADHAWLVDVAAATAAGV